MKKSLILVLLFSISALFGYNFNGTWTNISKTSYNDPVKLIIKNGNLISPYVKIGSKVAKLKSKKASVSGNALFEAWGFNNKNLILLIKPINSYKLKVIAKKIYVDKKKIITKSFIFTDNSRVVTDIKRRFVGSYINDAPLTPVNRVNFSLKDNKLIVKAWYRGRLLGATTAKVKNKRLYIDWKQDNIKVNAVIRGQEYDSNLKRYKKIKLYVKAKNLSSGLESTQTVYLKRGEEKRLNKQYCKSKQPNGKQLGRGEGMGQHFRKSSKFEQSETINSY